MILYQRPLVDPPSNWTPTPVSELPSWKGAARVGFDIETYDPEIQKLGPGIWRDGTYVAGVSFAIEDGDAFYLPVGHRENNLDPEQVWAYLREQAKHFDGDLVGANLGGYDLPWVGVRHGVRFPKVKRFADVQNADPIIDERHWSYKLDDILKRWNIPGKNEDDLRRAMIAWKLAEKTSSGKLNIKKNMALLPARHAALYAIDDAVRPLECLRRMEHVLEEQELFPAWDLECEVLPALVRVYERGVRIDQDHLQKVDDWALAELAGQLGFVKSEIGVDLWEEPGVKTRLGQKLVMCDTLRRLGIDIDTLPLTDGGVEIAAAGGELTDQHRKITAEVLGSFGNPVCDAMARGKKMDKLRGTFVKGIRDSLAPDGRCHTQFNQTKRQEPEDGDPTGTITFRFSSKSPNLQNQPSRDDYAQFYKQIFIPEDGHLWAKLDYSSQEPRFMVHYGVRAGIESAREMAARYWADPDLDTYTDIRIETERIIGRVLAETPKAARDLTKIILLAQAYGQSEGALCQKLGLPTELVERSWGKQRVAGPEGRAIIDAINGAAPYVKELADNAKAFARKHGYVRETVTAGRLRFPPARNGRGWDYPHKAFNKKVQGGAAKQTKRAFVELDREGYLIHLQVHDELDPSVRDEKHARDAAEIMMTCVPLEVPSMVDVLVGASWGEVKKC